MTDDCKWERWLREAVNSIPSGVSAGDAIRIEEILRDAVRRIETSGL